MRGSLCAGCLAVGAYAMWAGTKFMWPFLAFVIREKLKGNHETLLCRAHQECKVAEQNFLLSEEEVERHAVFSPDLSMEEVGKIHSLWQRRCREKRSEKKGLKIVHIGPADLMEEDQGMYQRIKPLMEAEDGGRVILVEPHPGQQSRLRERIYGILDRDSVTILPTAICPTLGDSVTFYRISDNFFRRFDDYAFYIRYWASLDKQHLIDETQFFNSNQKVWLFKALHIFPKHFPESVEDWLPYIEAVHVKCHTPASLLAETQLEPRDVDVLILDAEGYDTELMHMFLAMDGFAPASIMFEWHLHANNASKLGDLLQLVRAVHARGYDIHRHNHDIVAVARPA